MKGKISTLSVCYRLVVTCRMLGGYGYGYGYGYGVAAPAQWPSR